MNIKIISAGAGSGKTYRLTQELVAAIRKGTRPSGIIATTFTNKAAAELKERVTIKLLEEGLVSEAQDFNNALIGTVHSIGVQLLKRFAFVAGVSPKIDILPDEEHQSIFNKSLVSILSENRIDTMEKLVQKFDLNVKGNFDWRSDVRAIADQARINDFSKEDLTRSRKKSLDLLFQFLPTPVQDPTQIVNQFLTEIKLTRNALTNQTIDSTIDTKKAIAFLGKIEKNYAFQNDLLWRDWVAASNLKVGAKSRELVADLKIAAGMVERHPQLRADIETYIQLVFEMAEDAIDAYAQYKNQRGLIDYSDMETHVRELIVNPMVKEILEDEIDLLMVDEFQDTSPIQLDIFWKIAQMVAESIWVGDPKQAIYSFRGAEPDLMEGIVQVTGGIKKENILPFSWRSREDLVDFSNIIFSKAFQKIPEERVALVPKRTLKDDPTGMENGIIHWAFTYEDKGRINNHWVLMSMAYSLKEWLSGKHLFLPKGDSEARTIKPGDVAILFRRNKDVKDMAQALNLAGLDSAVAGVGLASTAEAVLIMACLRAILSQSDSLAIAEILKYAEGWTLKAILDSRQTYLSGNQEDIWAIDVDAIEKLHNLRKQIPDMTIMEVLDLVLEELQIRRIVQTWTNANQRLDNIALLRGYTRQFEELCRRTHRPATPAGFVLYLDELAQKSTDNKSGGVHAQAVNVLTYHKSKGLEWPVVICGSLGSTLRVNPFGVKVVNESSEMNVENLLANRWLRYWVNPFGTQLNKSALMNRLKESEVYQSEEEKAREEEARLLYVGITRARDYLILPYVKNQMGWLNRVANGGEKDVFLGDEPKTDLPTWKGKQVPITFEPYGYSREFTPQVRPQKMVGVPVAKAMKNEHQPYFWDINRDRPKNTKAFKTIEIVQFAEPLPTSKLDNLLEAANAMNAIVIGFQEGNDAHNLEMVERILSNYQVALNPEEVFRYVESLYVALTERMDIKGAIRLYLLEGKHLERQVSLQVDFWDNQSDYVTILQNHYHSSTKKTVEKQVEELANFFSWVREIAPDGLIFNQGFVHLSMMGVLGVLAD